jgi:ABC-2 type transport system permease protein
LRIKPTLAFTLYEIRRALARKKVLAVVIPTILLDTLPYYILSTSGADIIPGAVFPYVWVAGVFAPFSLFIQFTAILIAAGAMSEEYEQGTAELLLSKPVSRTEYFVGKFLGGYLLLFFVILLSAVLSVATAFATYGPQSGLDILPGIVLSQAYASALFYSLAYMLGELIRRSSLSYIFASAVFLSSQLIGVYMSFVYQLTGKEIYRTIHVFMPTAPVDSLPLQYAIPRLPTVTQSIFQFITGTGVVEPTFAFSIVLITGYVVSAIAIALAYFGIADISRRVS